MTKTTERSPKAATASPLEPAIRRKNLNIDQSKLNRVRDLLGARTETDAVDQALAMVLFRDELMTGVRRIAGSGGVENVFENDSQP
jgi:hypothetical protein